MKTKKYKHNFLASHPFHIHLDYFFRHPYCLVAVIALMAVVTIKSEDKVFGVVRDAYAHGYGIVGQHMREETPRIAVTFESPGKLPTISGK